MKAIELTDEELYELEQSEDEEEVEEAKEEIKKRMEMYL